MEGFVSKDLSDGRVTLWDGSELVASKVDGVWSKGGFDADDLKDNFNRVLDETEANRLVNEAKASLSV